MTKKSTRKELIKTNIGRGIAGAISRNTLSVLVKASEDQVRNLIRELRYVDHEIICSIKNDTVYFYPDSVDDAITQLDDVMNKQKQVMDYIQHIQDYIKVETGGIINYKNLPDIDVHEKERRSIEEIF